jgi:hypothetical protein
MQKRIEVNRKVRELLWKLERKRTFTGQFKSAQEYIEFSLEEALKWMDRFPHKEIKGYGDFETVLQDCRREHFQKNAKGISEKAKGQEDQETSVN